MNYSGVIYSFLMTVCVVGLGLLFGPTPVQAQQVDPAQETIALQTAAAMALNARYGERSAGIVLSIAGANVDGRWGVVYVHRSTNDTRYGSGGYALIGVLGADGWHFTFPDDAGYDATVLQVPDSLLDPLSKVIARSSATGPVAAARSSVFDGYRLPWPAPEPGRVTQPYSVHGLGQIDFWIPSGSVSAAKAGDVVYVQDGHHLRGCDGLYARYNNAVVIRHGPGEYTLYLHIEPNSVPPVIKEAVARYGSAQVLQGETIARQGNSGFTCGLNGIHLHLSSAAGFTIYPSPDIFDEDGDGDREEAVETVWGVEHHAIDFMEAAYPQLANWPFEQPILSLNQRQSACTASQATGVTVFDAVGCLGDQRAFDGESSLVNLTESGWNDRIRSLVVAEGWSTRVYEHIHGLGTSTCLAGRVVDLAAVVFGEDGTSVDRAISSLQVFHSETCLPAPVDAAVSASADDVQVTADVRVPISYSFTLTGSTGVRFTALTYAVATPSTPLIVGDTVIAVDVAVPANGDTTWPTNLVLEPLALEDAWEMGLTEIPLSVTFSGEDGVGRGISVATQIVVSLGRCGDGGEWNGAPLAATPLTIGGAQVGVICPAGDFDFFAFDGAAGQSIVAAAQAVGSGSMLDAHLELLAGDGSTRLASGDDVTDTLDAVVQYVLPVDGRYFLAVSSADRWEPGPGYTYTITLGQGESLMSPCIAQPDRLEPDDEVAQTSTVETWGIPLARTFHLPEDQDWVRFHATGGVTYTVTASSKYVDVALQIFASDAMPNTAGESASKEQISTLVWQPQATGFYLVRSRLVNMDAPACRRAYRLQIDAADRIPPQVGFYIDDNRRFTTGETVTLTLAMTDAGTGIGDVLIANDSALNSGAWQPYTQVEGNWELAAGDGLKTVYVEVRDLAGNVSTVVSDTIVLDKIPPYVQVALEGGQSTFMEPVVPLQLVASLDTQAFRLRVAGEGWGPWQPYRDKVEWSLPDIAGLRQVHLQVRDEAGNLSEISAVDLLYLCAAVWLPAIFR